MAISKKPVFMVLLAFSLAGPANRAGAAQTNLIDNGSFEQGARGWNKRSRKIGHELDRSRAADGKVSARLSLRPSERIPTKWPSQARTLGWIKYNLPVEGGGTYTLSAKVMAKMQPGQVGFFLRFYDQAGKGEGGRKIEQKSALLFDQGEIKDWTTMAFTFVAPEKAKMMHLEIGARNLVGDVWIDDVRMVSGREEFVIPEIKTPPVIDGRLNDEVYRTALKCAPFLAYPSRENRAPAAEDTEAWICMDKKNIYLAVLCHMKEGREPVANVKIRDGHVWNDDCVEFFFDANRDGRTYYHYIINAVGTIYDAHNFTAAWNGNAEIKTGKAEGGAWTVEARFPLKDFGITELEAFEKVKRMAFNICREHSLKDSRRLSSWAPLSPQGFHQPQMFIPVVNGSQAPVELVSFLHRASDQVAAIRMRRHWKIEDPLYEELISAKKGPHPGESCYIWGHPLDRKANRIFALQYGQRYSREEILEEYQRHRLHPFSGWPSPGIEEWCRNTGIGYIYYARAHHSGKGATIRRGHRSGKFLYEPQAVEAYLENMKKTLSEKAPAFWGVSTGDEVIELNNRRFIAALGNPEIMKKYPYFHEAIAEIKEKYGYGKFGPPMPGQENGPYHWLAYHRWLMAKVVDTQKRLYAAAKKLKVGPKRRPPVVFGEDSMGGLRPYHYSRQGPYMDIATGQQTPRNAQWRQTFAFKVKFLHDLTGKPVWLTAHVENYPGAYSVAEVNEFLSEAVRVGGTGFQFWDRDHAGGQRGTNDTRWCYYGHRERWDHMMDCVDRLRGMNRLKFPRPEFALFFSNDHCLAGSVSQVSDYEVAFNLLGPAARTWFKFISDIQVADGKVKLSEWKTIVIPKASIIRKEVSEQFLDYAQAGRTLVTFDPDVFSNHADGSSTVELRQKIFGVKHVEGTLAPTQLALSQSDLWPGTTAATRLPVVTTLVRKVALLEGAETVAKFEDGSPAIVVKKGAGGGRAIYFSFSLTQALVADKGWRDFFKSFAQGLGLKTDQDIWRFRFPLPRSVPPRTDPDAVQCLTGNHLVWWINEVLKINNRAAEESGYTYSLAPDAPAEQFPGARHSFQNGDLTDRLTAPKAGNVENRVNKEKVKSGELSLDHFIVGWQQPEPVAITFDLGQEAQVERVRLVYTRSLPDLKVEVSRDGKTYAEVATGSGWPVTNAVLDAELRFKPRPARFVRLTIGKRIKGDKLILSEVEIWGK